jgi:hypothetical protein
MTNLNLIGIGGTDGSGKDSLGEMLQERHGWLFVSVTDILRGELNNRGISLRRENLRSLGDEWRRAYGPGVLVAKALEIYEKQTKKYNGLVLASMRNPGEADTLHNDGGILVWVDAEARTATRLSRDALTGWLTLAFLLRRFSSSPNSRLPSFSASMLCVISKTALRLSWSL